MICEALSHRRFGRYPLGVGFAKIVTALGPGVSVMLPSRMIGVDQSIITERGQTFGESINRALLAGGEHF